MDFEDWKICERETVCRSIEDCCDWCRLQRVTSGLAGQVLLNDLDAISMGIILLGRVYNDKLPEAKTCTAARRDLLALASMVLKTAAVNLKFLETRCDCPDCTSGAQAH